MDDLNMPVTVIPAEQYDALVRLIDEPMPDTAKLDRLFSRPSPFDV